MVDFILSYSLFLSKKPTNILENHHIVILQKSIVKFFLIAAFVFFAHNNLFAQRILGDCTIYYTVTYKDKDKDSLVVVNALKTVYIHGAKVRTDFSFSTSNYLQTVIQNNNLGTVTVLKEIGVNKYKTTLDSSGWRLHNTIYNNIKTNTDEDFVKVILGYRCGKATLSLENGAKYDAYYTLDVTPSSKENKYQFKDVPGVILQYESVDESTASPIVIKAKSINLMPISDHLFNIPTKGYRISNDF
ncbi:MAG: hypothetical protein DI598_02475 [Pseudopedobacter saltans]|uniref:DUF4412 domain-containing protein n=1 Tax=Pseudopedobacter saltans TaxID=151895 RepID=A0A2W5FDM5_9SPHI|nr:MAG: hypothetical protein DI598_02475 [Pseudopedobacter saltans]